MNTPDNAHATRRMWILLTVLGTLTAVVLGANGPLGGFWGVEEADPEPSASALAGLISASLVESIAFGVGIAWIALGWRLVKDEPRRLAVATYLAAAWALVSWAPHTSFHVSLAEGNWAGLVAVEWGFHVTQVIGTFTIATYLWSKLKDDRPLPASAAA